MSKRASLTSLLAELRDMIWFLALVSHKPLDAYIGTRTAIHERRTGRSSRRIRVLERKRWPETPHITAVNRELRAETLAYWLHNNIFVFQLCSSWSEASWARNHEVEEWWHSLALRDMISAHDRMRWTIRLDVHTINTIEIHNQHFETHLKAMATVANAPTDTIDGTRAIGVIWSFEDEYRDFLGVYPALLRSLTDQATLDSLHKHKMSPSADATMAGALASRVEEAIKLWRDERPYDLAIFEHHGNCRACATRRMRAAADQRTFQLGEKAVVDV